MRANGAVFRLADMIGSSRVSTGLPDGREVRAVPERFAGGIWCRLRASWQVLTGKAVATDWPAPGDLEAALKR